MPSAESFPELDGSDQEKKLAAEEARAQETRAESRRVQRMVSGKGDFSALAAWTGGQYRGKRKWGRERGNAEEE